MGTTGTTCPRCSAPRVDGPECPRCGVIYAKARARLAEAPAGWPPPAAPAAPPPPPGWPPPDASEPVPLGWPPLPEPPPAPEWPAPAGEAAGWPPPSPAGDVVGDARGLASLGRGPAAWTGDADAAAWELRVRTLAPPLALLVMWALVSTGPGQMLVRTFLSMWIHELGHATAAWLCGRWAFPGPWRTWWGEARSPVVILALAGALGVLGWWGWRAGRRGVVAAAAGGLTVQLLCVVLPDGPRRAFITFAGDGGAMVIGAALFATIWASPQGPLGRGGLRWGFLVIGAAAVVDPLRQWVIAWRDPRELPLGHIEGVGLSDASRLVEQHGWAPAVLSRAYVLLGLACLAALAALYAVALRRARAEDRRAG